MPYELFHIEKTGVGYEIEIEVVGVTNGFRRYVHPGPNMDDAVLNAAATYAEIKGKPLSLPAEAFTPPPAEPVAKPVHRRADVRAKTALEKAQAKTPSVEATEVA